MNDETKFDRGNPVRFGGDELASRSDWLMRSGLDLLGMQADSSVAWLVIEALVLALEAQDQTAPSDIRRVQVYVAGLAGALGMSVNDIRGLKMAAMLYDIGRLAIPKHILTKPGPLTDAEMQKIRIHPEVGAEIISGVPFPYPVAAVILSHHERWDGKGYPAGLKAEDIPIGARILSTVDYFDALMSERPYHKAMSSDAAMDILRQDSGKALDPRVVQTFIEIYPALAAEADAARTHESPPRTEVFHDITLAHREICGLYEIAQAMGSHAGGVADTMAIISSKLSTIVPFSCCALFLYSEETETLRCRFATGVESEQIQQMTIRCGHGVTGWVARNRRPVRNARPDADFEAAGSSPATSLQSALVCPLVVAERLIGTISVYHTEEAAYTADHLRLLDRISEQAAAVIDNSVLFEQAQEDSLIDPLTGLPNTRYMFMHVTRELARAARLGSEVSLLLIDLDNFKKVNDDHGLAVGDRALRAAANVLGAAIRPYDLCVRWMSDKFIVVLSGCGGEEAQRKRTELQRAVDALRFEARPGEVLPLAVSIGAGIFPHDGDSYEQLVAVADRRMCDDKHRRKMTRLASLSPSSRPKGAPDPEAGQQLVDDHMK